MSYIIIYRMQTYDAIIIKKGPIPWPCCDLRGCARLAKMDAGHWWLPNAISNQEGKKERHKKNFMTRPSQMLRPTYRLWWHDGKTWMSYMLHTTSSKSNIDHFIINYCSDPRLQNVHNIFFAEITGLLSIYNQSSEKFSYWIPSIGQPRDTKNS